MLINWVAALQPLTERKGWYWDLDGRLRITKYSQQEDTPWLHNPIHIPGSREAGLDCGILTIFHNHVFGGQAAHSFCMECYKVVVVLETLAQVHKMADWQQTECTKNEWACKVGAERRKYTPRNWGAYFYCRGVEEGRERYKAVRKWVDENLGKDVRVFLKRACTEFEQNMGDSDKWKKIKYQDEIEAEGKDVIDYNPMAQGQGAPIQHHVYDVWDYWDNQTQKPVTYHDEGD
jgi:hypothetical protein